MLASVSLYLFLFFSTAPQYGINFDEAQGESFLGDRYFAFLTTGDHAYLELEKPMLSIYHEPDHPDYHARSGYARKNVHHIWGLGHTLGAATKWLLYTKLRVTDPTSAQHFSQALLMGLLSIALFLFASRWSSPLSGAIAVLFLLVHPLLWSHAHYNAKDVPELVFYSLTLCAFLEGLLRRSWRWVLGTAFLFGLSLAAKANALFLIPTAVLMTVIFFLWRGDLHYRELALKSRANFGRHSFVIALLLAPLVTALTAMIAWPYLLADFPNGLLKHIEFLQERGLEGTASWKGFPSYLLLITSPVLFLGLALFGGVVSLMQKGRPRLLALLLLPWIVVPLLRVSLPYAKDFDGIRHWMEILVPLALFAGVGTEVLLRRLSLFLQLSLRMAPPLRRIVQTIFVLSIFAPTLEWNIRNHPFQYVYYNALFGGLGAAQAADLPEAGDYWGISYRNAVGWLNVHAPKNSILYVAFAQHVVHYTEETWLRPDIRRRNIERLAPETRKRALSRGKGPQYLLVAERKGHLPKWFPDFPLHEQEKVHEIQVDKGTVYAIYRLAKSGESAQ
ncbi:glycosyltransferase family 39 protein [bacterium]|nr:glycosyltransferase family 39 protein [bacterium]